MITVLVGHRGVGKTSLLKRISHYLPEAVVFCLDEEIEKKYGSIQDIFSQKGEPAFRQIEQEMFHSLYETYKESSQQIFMALGAGFTGALPSDVFVLWVRRQVDMSRFKFLNRPPLSKNATLLTMPLEIFTRRELFYSRLADEQLMLPEGIYLAADWEEAYFKNTIKNVGGVLTLLPEHIERPRFEAWIKKRDQWGLHFFEVREDLLSVEQINLLLLLQLQTPLLYSFRCPTPKLSLTRIAQNFAAVDWEHSLGRIPDDFKNKYYISLHSSAGEFERDFALLNREERSIKWAPIIENFTDLARGHRWMMQNPDQRSFLPRSMSGRWAWYRQLMKNKMSLNFWREDKGSSLDQPTFAEWFKTDVTAQTFAAVLGSPINHSWSPTYHQLFFREHKMNFLSLEMTEAEAQKSTFEFLHGLGLRAAAVTSPLKHKAAEISRSNQNSINTLVWSVVQKKWMGLSTDEVGFDYQIEKSLGTLHERKIIIWGAGRMAEMILKKHPQAIVVSARTGDASDKVLVESAPEVLIWASGDKGYELLVETFPFWCPQFVIDLNYREDSPAISYAFLKKAKYISGRDMFFAQANEQQKFWRKELQS